jgi:hypothetical protein
VGTSAERCKHFPTSPIIGHRAKALLPTGGIAEWAALDGPRDETVLIVDPDSMFVRPLVDPGPLPAGQAYSQEHDYMCRHPREPYRDRPALQTGSACQGTASGHLHLYQSRLPG